MEVENQKDDTKKVRCELDELKEGTLKSINKELEEVKRKVEEQKKDIDESRSKVIEEQNKNTELIDQIGKLQEEKGKYIDLYNDSEAKSKAVKDKLEEENKEIIRKNQELQNNIETLNNSINQISILFTIII